MSFFVFCFFAKSSKLSLMGVHGIFSIMYNIQHLLLFKPYDVIVQFDIVDLCQFLIYHNYVESPVYIFFNFLDKT